MNIDDYKFTHEMKVRDYECDLQGIVNNANYQHYMEHSRHELLSKLGVNFGKLHEDGIDAMVAKITIEYKTPLRSGDEFVVGINLERKGPKIIFYQDISSKIAPLVSLPFSTQIVSTMPFVQSFPSESR